MEKPTVRALGRAYFGAPEGCPSCGGQLVPDFGQMTDEQGRLCPVVDSSSARCRKCGETFKTAMPDRAS